MKAYNYILVLGFCFFVATGFSQKQKVNEAFESYEDLEFLKTSTLLLEAVNNGNKSVEIYEKLGNAYYFNKKMESAVVWYTKMLDFSKNKSRIDSEFYFRFSHALKAIEEYAQADQMMHTFHKLNPTDSRGKLFIADLAYLDRLNGEKNFFEIFNLESNSGASDFGSTLFEDQLYFSSSRNTGEIYAWNNEYFLDLFTVKKQEDGSYGAGEVISLNETINTEYHESTASFTPDGKEMYFTRSNYFKGKLRKDKQGVHRLKIFKATLIEGEWGAIESLPFNSDNYSVAHPSVSGDGTKLYFASDMPSSRGESDIYVVDIYPDGSYGDPKNLGSSINTEGQESFPYINKQGDLFFSSNGLVGLGGLDVFVIRGFENIKTSNKALIPENIGRPINSSLDDFGYYEDKDLNNGFFTSNRSGGKGSDDIYSFMPIPNLEIEIVTKDAKTDELLAGPSITIFDSEGNLLEKELKEKSVGLYSVVLNRGETYLIKAGKEDYISGEIDFYVPREHKGDSIRAELLLYKIEKELDLAEVLDLPVINFDLDKSNIRLDAALELDKIVVLLKEYSSIKIFIKAHTDSRGSDLYNLKLSDRRAQATLDYLVNSGIDINRLSSKGFGETLLLNKCENGVICTDEEHEENRRSEFIITDK